jgi:hypothetical protein
MAAIDGELGRHMLAPNLFKRQRSQECAVGVAIKMNLPGRFVVAIAHPGGGAFHTFGVFDFDEHGGGFAIRCNHTDCSIECGPVGEKTVFASAGGVFEDDLFDAVDEVRQQPAEYGGGEIAIRSEGSEHVEDQWHTGERVAEQAFLVDGCVVLAQEEFPKCQTINGRGQEVFAGAGGIGAEDGSERVGRSRNSRPSDG